jgi:hypothetical protein
VARTLDIKVTLDDAMRRQFHEYWRALRRLGKEMGLSYHEVRLRPGDPAEGPLGQTIVFVDDEGTTWYPGEKGYAEPEEGSAQFLADQGVQLAEDQHRIATGQDRQFAPEQREATLSEAERITDAQPGETVVGEGEIGENAVLPPEEDPNRQTR